MTHKTLKTILVCCSTPCKEKGAYELISAFTEILNQRAPEEQPPIDLRIRKTGCQGPCSLGPVVHLMEDDITYYHVQPKDAPAIVRCVGKKPLLRLLFHKNLHTRYKLRNQTPFFSLQKPLITASMGSQNPCSLDEYLLSGGFSFLNTPCHKPTGEEPDSSPTPSSNIPITQQTSLVSTSLFESNVAFTPLIPHTPFTSPHFLIPIQSSLEHILTESCPYALIEESLLLLKQTPLQTITFHITADHPWAQIKESKNPQASEKHPLPYSNANNQLTSPNTNELASSLAEAHLCHALNEVTRFFSEKKATEKLTAALDTIQITRNNTPYKADVSSSLPSDPSYTIISLFELLSMRRTSYPQLSTFKPNASASSSSEITLKDPKPPQSIIVQLKGAVKMGGIVEVSPDTTLHSLIFDLGSGIPDNRPFKAARIDTTLHYNPLFSPLTKRHSLEKAPTHLPTSTSIPLKLCVSETTIHTRIADFISPEVLPYPLFCEKTSTSPSATSPGESFRSALFTLTINVFDDRTCIPSLAYQTIRPFNELEYLSKELKALCSGKSSKNTFTELLNSVLIWSKNNAQIIASTEKSSIFTQNETKELSLLPISPEAHAAFGFFANTLSLFSEEYRIHAEEHFCPAGNCRALTRFFIDGQKCIGCSLCAQTCPTQSISGTPSCAHVINKQTCVSCGKCRDLCKNEAIAWKSAWQ